MELLILMKWRICEQEVRGEIMNTDVFVKIASSRISEDEMRADIHETFARFREFEKRFSRFIGGSELVRLNSSSGKRVSREMFDILERCALYYKETNGVFDPTVLRALEREGYRKSFGSAAFDSDDGTEEGAANTFARVKLLRKDRTVHKPKYLTIDLGGIGKGYIVDRVTETLAQKYEHVFVCAGGDIRAVGVDKENGYDFWAVDVEESVSKSGSVATILLKGLAVATSGVNRRAWTVENQKKHHLIDPQTGKSAETDLISVTVVSETAEEADVRAKVLCISGLKKGLELAKKRKLAALFVDQAGKVTYTANIKQYLWGNF